MEDLGSHLYFSEMRIPEGSPLVGVTLEAAHLGSELDLKVLDVLRDDTAHVVPRATTRLRVGDVLLVEGRREAILRAADSDEVDLVAEVEYSIDDLPLEHIGLKEVILVPGSPAIGRTLEALDFRSGYGLQVLAINRHGETLSRKMSHIRLRTADVLVVQGDRDHIRALERQGLFRILGPIDRQRSRRKRAPVAIAIFLATLLVATANVFPLSVTMLLGALLVLTTRCITPGEAYNQVNWTALILIACMLGLGTAMETTGTASFLAQWITRIGGGANPVWLLSAFFAVTVLLTQPMSNQASAALVLPIAMQAAR